MTFCSGNYQLSGGSREFGLGRSRFLDVCLQLRPALEVGEPRTTVTTAGARNTGVLQNPHCVGLDSRAFALLPGVSRKRRRNKAETRASDLTDPGLNTGDLKEANEHTHVLLMPCQEDMSKGSRGRENVGSHKLRSQFGVEDIKYKFKYKYKYKYKYKIY